MILDLLRYFARFPQKEGVVSMFANGSSDFIQYTELLGYGQALKTSGDAVFPVVMGAVFMYLAAVGGTYFFGLHLGLLAVGAYIGLASDECIRAVGMVLRWNSGKWKNKGLVD